MITHVGVTILYVSDQQRAVDFFVGKLGFQKTTDGEMWPGARWIAVTPPGGQTEVALLHPHPQFEAEIDPRDVPFTLQCDDIRATVEQLRANGVDAPDPKDEPWGVYTQVTDPDGHTIVIGERKQ